MHSIRISVFIFVCVFGSALVGVALRSRMPKEHISGDSKDTIKVGMGLVGTMVALVLGLLVASAKGQFDSQSNELTGLSVNVVLLDRMLAHYGPEANQARVVLRESAATVLDRLSSSGHSHDTSLDPTHAEGIRLYESIERLAPQNDVQRSLQAQGLSTAVAVGRSLWLMYERESAALPLPLLSALAFWLAITFLSFGLFAPPNATAAVSLFVAALSVASAVFLVLEMYSPQTGVITISSAPLRNALAHLGQ